MQQSDADKTIEKSIRDVTARIAKNSVDLAENAEVTETWRNAGNLMDHPTTTVECAGEMAKALRALESWAASGADEGVRTVAERLHRTNTTITFLHAPGDDGEMISVRMTARINNRRSKRSWLARHLWNEAVATIEVTKRWFDNEAMWLLKANRHRHIIKGALDAGDAGKTTSLRLMKALKAIADHPDVQMPTTLRKTEEDPETPGWKRVWTGRDRDPKAEAPRLRPPGARRTSRHHRGRPRLRERADGAAGRARLQDHGREDRDPRGPVHGDPPAVKGNHNAKLAKALSGRDVQRLHGLAKTMEALEAGPEAFAERVRKFMDGSMPSHTSLLIDHRFGNHRLGQHVARVLRPARRNRPLALRATPPRLKRPTAATWSTGGRRQCRG